MAKSTAPASSDTIMIGSKLPNGLTLHDPVNVSVTVTIRGTNSAPQGLNGVRMLLPFMTTPVPVEFWKAWKFAHDVKNKPFKPLSSGAIFECPNGEPEKVYREREKEKTGFEPTSKIYNGVKPDLGKD